MAKYPMVLCSIACCDQARVQTLITQVTSLVEEVERLKLENARLRGTPSAAATPASNPFAPAPTVNPFNTQATPPPASGATSQPAAPAPAPNPFAQAGVANPAPALPPSAPPPPPPAPMPLTRSTGYTRVLRPAPADTVPTAVLLICYNRPRYLQRALDSIVKYVAASCDPRWRMWCAWLTCVRCAMRVAWSGHTRK